jgi:REP-associated tyrosine transposase
VLRHRLRRRGDVFGNVVGVHVELNATGLIVRDCVEAIPAHHDVILDEWIVMPDHVHAILFLGLGSSRPALATVVGTFKAAVSRTSARRQIWQRGYYDHVVRDDDDLDRVREYIVTNPTRWTLRHGTSGPDVSGPYG